MAAVTVETVEQVARLARLSLTPDECQTFTRQLEQILSYAQAIQELDTSAVEPMSHALASGTLREDVHREGLDRDQVLASAPDTADGLFRVPRILG